MNYSVYLQCHMQVLKGILLKTWQDVGGLGQPSKMPCYSYSTPAEKCKIGSKLRNVENSVCSKCYAFRGFYNYPNAKNALKKRYLALNDVNWVANMTLLIGKLECSGYFRWHDSGDIQDISHFEKICQIARNLPKIKFWLPTREYTVIAEYVKNKKTIPRNLTVRLSAYIVDGPLPSVLAKRLGVVTSGVTKQDNFNCPASKQNNFCLDCRKCWDKRVETVIYSKH